MTSIIVGTSDLRAALSSVGVHACTDQDLYWLCRIRLLLDREHVTIIATDRASAAISLVSIIDTPDPPGDRDMVVDLMPSDVKKILAFHHAGKEEPGETPTYQLRLEIRSGSVAFTDCSGMIDGRSVRLPRLPGLDGTEDSIGQVLTVIARTQSSEPVLIDDVAVGGESVARFKTAAKAYGHPLIFEARLASKSILIRCGESFLGLLTPSYESEDALTDRKAWAEAWSYRLADVGGQS